MLRPDPGAGSRFSGQDAACSLRFGLDLKRSRRQFPCLDGLSGWRGLRGSLDSHWRFLVSARLARAVDVATLDDAEFVELCRGFGAVAFCTDIVPDEISVELELPVGVNYARAAQILRPPSRKVRKFRKPRGPERGKVG
jgi:hypothetical protein